VHTQASNFKYNFIFVGVFSIFSIFMKEIILFFKNGSVQKQILFAVIGLIIFIQLIFLGIRVYTRHGQALSVPDFVGQSLDEADKTADQTKLRLNIIDSVFIQGQKPGTVVAQTPSPSTKVKANRTIFLTINAFNPEKIDMPNLLNYPVRQAEAIIQTNGLRIGNISYVPNLAKDFVLRQLYRNRDISSGSKIIKGSSVDLVVGMGLGNADVSVPNLKGLTQGAAQDIISGKYLAFGAIICDNSIETYQDSIRAVIWKQKPEPGSSISMGGAIDIWLKAASISKTDSTATHEE
jgi:eukaryotic-like serine/threonine-protein kinase